MNRYRLLCLSAVGRHFSRAYSSARPDVIILRRSELIQELCKANTGSTSNKNINLSSEPGVKSWSSQFIATAHILESFMLLHHHKLAKTLLYRYRAVDPDRADRYLQYRKAKRIPMLKNNCKGASMEELSFLTQFTYILKQAGYTEVSQESVKRYLDYHHKYEGIELEVKHNDYIFARFWVHGCKTVDEKNTTTLNQTSKEDSSKRLVLHDRVIVASRSRKSNNMILKGFKDVPESHFESLLPEAKILIPRGRKWLMNISLTATGLIAFVNVGMIVLTDFKVDIVWMLLLFSGFIAYRTSTIYKSQRNKYILAWKEMLYYKSTANNEGLVLDSINRAHERSLKEALIVYGTALRLSEAGRTVTEDEVIREACRWLSSINQRPVSTEDLMLSSSFSFLQHLGLLVLVSHDRALRCSRFSVLPLDQASETLSRRVLAISSE